MQLNEGATILNKILSTASKSLGIAGQLIPLYQDSEPIIKAVRSVYSNLKENKKILPKELIKGEKKKENPIQEQKEKVNNNPQFFI